MYLAIAVVVGLGGIASNNPAIERKQGMLNAMKEYYETTGLGDVKSAVSGSQTYDFQMNPLTGWLKQCISRQRVIIETTILKSNYLPAGLKIPSYTETVFEVTGGRLEKAFKP